jgi:hypothetical protein
VSGDDQHLEQARRGLRAWAEFPADREPRPLVLLSPAVRAPSFGTDARAKLAFVRGAVEAVPGFPAEILHAMRPHRQDAGPPPDPLVLTTATLGTAEFVTDRGPRQLPAWEVRAQGVPEPFWVLDPGTSLQAWPRQGLDEQQVSWGHSTAVVGADGRTVTLRFIFGSGYADCPSAEVLEAGGAVAVVPAEADPGPPGFRAMPARPREVTAVLTRPLGPRVLLDGLGLPVMVLS